MKPPGVRANQARDPPTTAYPTKAALNPPKLRRILAAVPTNPSKRTWEKARKAAVVPASTPEAAAPIPTASPRAQAATPAPTATPAAPRSQAARNQAQYASAGPSPPG